MSTKLKLAQAALSRGGGGADGLNHRHTNIILWEGGREFTDLDPVNSRFLNQMPQPTPVEYASRTAQPSVAMTCFPTNNYVVHLLGRDSACSST